MAKNKKRNVRKQPPAPDWNRMVMVEPELQFYNVSLPSAWAKEFTSQLDGLPRYVGAGRDLVLNLRTVEIVARMPYYLQDGTVKFVSGFMQSKKTTATTERMVNHIAATICRVLNEWQGEISFTADHMEIIRSVCFDLKDSFYKAAEQADAMYLRQFPDELWEAVGQDKGFRLGMWGSQRSAFVSAYNYYEAFIVDCLRIKRQNPSFKAHGRKVGEAVDSTWGPEVCDGCFDNRMLKIARFVRHALSHNGGRETDELRNNLDGKPHGLPIEGKDKMLHVMPQHVTMLLGAIAKGATALVTAIERES